MPYAIFYDGHYAVHGTEDIGRLGRPASAGCVRLHPDNARVLFEMARQEGLENTRIVVMN
jgi:lipoprotein-anchoring transpeptidase ErfK/SrfK